MCCQKMIMPDTVNATLYIANKMNLYKDDSNTLFSHEENAFRMAVSIIGGIVGGGLVFGIILEIIRMMKGKKSADVNKSDHSA